MKYGLFKRWWSLDVWSVGLAEWTMAKLVRFRALLQLWLKGLLLLGCERRD